MALNRTRRRHMYSSDEAAPFVPAGTPVDPPDGESFILHSIDLSGGVLFGYHEAIGGSITGPIAPATAIAWFFSNPATTINIQCTGSVPEMEGYKLVRDGVGEMPLQGHTSFAGGPNLGITLPNLGPGLGITAAGDFAFHFEPFARTGPLMVSGRDNGGQTEWQSGSTFADSAKQGAEDNDAHPLMFVRVAPDLGAEGGSVDVQYCGDTLALYAGKSFVIDGQSFAFDDATADFDTTFTGRTYYLWADVDPTALDPGTLYEVSIA